MQMDDHFVNINYYADISEDNSSDKTATSEQHFQIHDDRISTDDIVSVETTNTTCKRRTSVVQPKVACHRLLAASGILFIIGLFSVPIVLYYTLDRVDLSILTATSNISLVSIATFYDTDIILKLIATYINTILLVKYYCELWFVYSRINSY